MSIVPPFAPHLGATSVECRGPCGPGHDLQKRPAVSGSVSSDPTHRLLRRLLDIQERDRQLVAYDIHDGFVQKATAASLHLQAFRELYGENPAEAWRNFDAAVRALGEGIHEARRLIAGLRPPILEKAGVVAAIDSLSHEVNERGAPKIEFSHAVRFDRLAPLLETTVFRIVQESLNNACRHSQSEKVRISLVQVGDRVRLEVQDWGIGFDPETVDKSRFGLEGIQERARLVGGHASIESSPGEGTRVVVELPVRIADDR